MTEIIVRPLQESDLTAAERVCRIAFGTFLGAPDPATFWADLDYVRGRWRAAHVAAFAAEAAGELVGSNFATNWGSVGFFGPLTIRPDLWDRGIGARLVEAAVGRLSDWGMRHTGLFTFAHSPKHVGLYQKFGYWPRFLTTIMALPVRPTTGQADGTRYSALTESDREACLGDCRDLSDAIYDGLDLTEEIRAVDAQQLGDTVMLADGGRVAAFAICHYGPKSEAGARTCLIKFAAVRPGPSAGQNFARLLDACEALAAAQGWPRLLAGVNTARHEAYLQMIGRGFRTEIQGVTMHRPNERGYSGPGVYVIGDWR